MKMNTLISYVLLVICAGTAFAQFDGGSSQLNFNEEVNRARLSPQQQGHILSDVQQHQHRFSISQNIQQQFPLQQAVPTNQQFLNQQQLLQNHQLLINNQPQIAPAPLNPEVQKKLQEKQAIIEKHNLYVEKQYEKALKKAQTDHVEFTDKQKDQKKKLYTRLYRPPGSPLVRYTLNEPRYLYPEEVSLFKSSVQKYYEEHPTTTTTTSTTSTTTTTTSPPPTTATAPKDLSPSSQNIYNEFQQPKIQFLPTLVPSPKLRSIQSLEDLSQLQSQYKNRQIRKDDLLAQLRLAIGENPEDSFGKNITSREISLANGQKVQIIKTSDPSLIPGATPLSSLNSLQDIVGTTSTAKPPKEYIEELTQGLPPGAKFEVLRHGEDGGLEQVEALPTNLPNQKKVTFVLLEEQADGSFKVQGVKGNGDKQKTGAEYDTILQQIKEGEIKLPINIHKPSAVPKTERPSTTPTTTATTTTTTSRTTPKYTISARPSTTTERITRTIKLSANLGVSSQSSPRPTTTNRTPTPTVSSRVDSSTRFTYQSFPNDLVRQASSSTSHSQNTLFNSVPSTYKPNPTVATYSSTTSVADKENDLTDVLKKHSLYAMAKFLKQSGLDTILNETGPYTVFAPTDKAFRTLLVQLGGPEKAEEKFKENPRLLSGLLLHHVIPGAFTVSSLQDEMTGVSLAGTQLRVNQYKMHDAEWNDVKVTTINGAKVLDDKQDVEIPQGIAHAVDRVMFPLPVGDLVQTLQSDRERRFTNFLRAIFTSGLVESLQSTKTFTFFAPTDKAFVGLSPEDVTKIVGDRDSAKELVMKHLIHGTLYTTGMRYYQIRDSLDADHQITLSKSSGKVKVNNAHIATQNIPATNGVIHAIDVLL